MAPAAHSIPPSVSSGSAVNGTGSGVQSVPPAGTQTPSSGSSAGTSTGYTAVTDDLYYSNGSLGTLTIPAIGVNAKIYEGPAPPSWPRARDTFPSPASGLEMSAWLGTTERPMKSSERFIPSPRGYRHPDHQAGYPDLQGGQREQNLRDRLERRRLLLHQHDFPLHLRDERAGIPLVRPGGGDRVTDGKDRFA